MARIQLLGGSYKQAAFIAGVQNCINLYPEKNPQTAQSPVGITHYPRPGNTPLGAPPNPGSGRGLYVSSLGDFYAFVGQSVYWVDPNWVFHDVGNVLINALTPIYGSDNGVTAIIVDGSPFGYRIILAAGASGTFSQLADPNYLGATRCDFLDYFLVFNEPGTPNWYCTQESSDIFNALFFGTKTAWPDNIITLITCERQAWLLGKYKSEIWSNAGTVPFPFQILSGNIVEHGTVSAYAVAKQDVNVYWLSESPEGARLAMRGALQQATRISTHAIEDEWLKYPRVDDCIIQTYQMRGHAFVEYHFPTADRCWVFDEATQEWHEKATYDQNGVQHRPADLFKAYAYGKNVAQDWRTGQLYLIDETNYTDNGAPILMERSMPHVQDEQEFNRLTVWRLIADMEIGSGTGVAIPTAERPWSLGFNPGFGPNQLVTPPQVSLYVSRDRGASFQAHSDQPLISTQGDIPYYNVKPTFNRCGQAYDFVFRLRWSGPLQTALDSVFITTEVSEGDS